MKQPILNQRKEVSKSKKMNTIVGKSFEEDLSTNSLTERDKGNGGQNPFSLLFFCF